MNLGQNVNAWKFVNMTMNVILRKLVAAGM